ncbi:hypothetical protein [Demequina mangrovi]|uniref:IPT/TIG domain-containing protein n=1 Tax=Demequina mangrovi TaxID=1043493 RepID=A0A1H6VUN4_9MICO|nr:hypothetical protein [Demequina mangrovi]SEJ08361.1 hypothetical protein SAMN05421637_0717 [Demequina mangrovi]
MPHRPLGRLIAAAATAAVVLGCAACGSVPDYPILEPRASAEVPEHVYAMRSLDIALTSASEGPVIVTGGTIFSPYFDRVDAVGLDVELAPGGSTTVTLPLGVVSCPAGEGDASAQLVLEVDGEELLQSVMLDAKGIRALNKEACELISERG